MKRFIAALLLTTGLAFAGSALAQEKLDKVVRVGALGDQSGLYQDIGGPGSAVAAQMAIEDSGLLAKGWKVDLISADHQNKPDVAVNIGKQWIDVEKVDVFVDLAASNVGLAIANLSREKNVVNLNSGSGSSDLTGAQCTPNTVHWAYDTYMLANGTGKALVKSGGDSWFLITADYAFGQALERDTTAAVTAAGGKVLGGVKHPLNTSDFSSFLLAGAALEGKSHRPRQCRRRHHQRHQAGRRVRHRRRRAEARGHADVHHRRQRARAQCRARPQLHRDLLLGHERPDPRLHQALHGDGSRRTRRPWCRPASIPR